MSWRSLKSSGYNRNEEKEETFYWLELFAQDDACHYWCDDYDEDRWLWFSYYGAPGYIQDMGELHLLRMMTLLHKLNIKEAKTILSNHGW